MFKVENSRLKLIFALIETLCLLFFSNHFISYFSIQDSKFSIRFVNGELDI